MVKCFKYKLQACLPCAVAEVFIFKMFFILRMSTLRLALDLWGGGKKKKKTYSSDIASRKVLYSFCTCYGKQEQ